MSENTHVATTPNKRPPTAIEVLRKNLEGEFTNTVTNYFRGDSDEALAFKTAVVDYVRKTPKLLECDRVSLMSAFVQVAQFRFLPSSVSGEMYVIPYGREAKPQLGYQGIVTLLYRAKTVTAITGNIIYENDHFEFEEGLNPKLVHKPAKFGTAKGAPIGAYTIAEMASGAKTFKVMSKDDIMAIKNLSKAKNSAESPWNSNKDPFNWMWLKTCLIQHFKLLPKTPELIKAIEIDNDGEGLDMPTLDPAGPATAKVHHGGDGVDTLPPDEPSIDITPEMEADFIENEKKTS